MEFRNLRGQSVRVLEVIGPVAGGVSLRRASVLAQPDDQELWEEATTIVRLTSYWRIDGAGAGAAVGAGTGYGAGKGALIGTGVGAAAGAIDDITKK